MLATRRQAEREFNPRCLTCGRGLTNPMVKMSPSILVVLGDCAKCGSSVTASDASWSPEDFHLDLDGNVLGQLELPLER